MKFKMILMSGLLFLSCAQASNSTYESLANTHKNYQKRDLIWHDVNHVIPSIAISNLESHLKHISKRNSKLSPQQKQQVYDRIQNRITELQQCMSHQ